MFRCRHRHEPHPSNPGDTSWVLQWTGQWGPDCTSIRTPVSPQLMTTSHGTRVTPSSSDIGNHNLLRLPPQRPHLFQILWPAGPRSVTVMCVFCPQVPGFPMAQISHEGWTWVTTLCFTSHKTHTCPRAQSPGPQVLGRPRSHHHTPDHTCIGNLEQHLCSPVTSLSSCSGMNAHSHLLSLVPRTSQASIAVA